MKRLTKKLATEVDLYFIVPDADDKTLLYPILAKIVDLTVQIDEYLRIFAYTAFTLSKPLFKRKEAMCMCVQGDLVYPPPWVRCIGYLDL